MWIILLILALYFIGVGVFIGVNIATSSYSGFTIVVISFLWPVLIIPAIVEERRNRPKKYARNHFPL